MYIGYKGNITPFGVCNWLVYHIRDYTTQSSGNWNKPLFNNHYSMESKRPQGFLDRGSMGETTFFEAPTLCLGFALVFFQRKYKKLSLGQACWPTQLSELFQAASKKKVKQRKPQKLLYWIVRESENRSNNLEKESPNLTHCLFYVTLHHQMRWNISSKLMIVFWPKSILWPVPMNQKSSLKKTDLLFVGAEFEQY